MHWPHHYNFSFIGVVFAVIVPFLPHFFAEHRWASPNNLTSTSWLRGKIGHFKVIERPFLLLSIPTWCYSLRQSSEKIIGNFLLRLKRPYIFVYEFRLNNDQNRRFGMLLEWEKILISKVILIFLKNVAATRSLSLTEPQLYNNVDRRGRHRSFHYFGAH